MIRREHGLMLAAAAIAGFMGGIISSNLFSTDTVIAQSTPKSPRIVEANEFRLVDDQGRTRAVLGMDNMLISYLRLQDLNGNTRLSMSVNRFHETSGIFLYGTKDTYHSASMHTLKDGTSSLTFYYDAVPRAALGNELGTNVNASSTPSLQFWEKGEALGKPLWRAP